MELIKAVRKIYAGYSNTVMLTDKSFKQIWCNRRASELKFYKLRTKYLTYHEGEITETVISEYDLGNDLSCAVKIDPLREDGKLLGYIVEFFDLDKVVRLSDNSGARKMRAESFDELTVGFSQCALAAEKACQEPGPENNELVRKFILWLLPR